MMNRASVSGVVFVALLTGVLASALPRDAEAGVAVTPVIVNASIKKDGEVLPPIKVKNTSKESVIIKMRFAPLGHDLYGGPTSPMDYAFSGDKLLSVTPNNFKLKPGASKEVSVKVKAPKNRAGGAYAIMYVLGEPEKVDANQTITAKTQVGVVLTLAMPGPANVDISAGSIFATQNQVGDSVSLFTTIENKGKVHGRVVGVVAIEGKKGTVATVRLRPGNVLPGFSRYLQGDWKPPKDLAAGTYKLRATLSLPDGTTKYSIGEMRVLKKGELVRYKSAVTKFATAPVVKNKPIALEATVLNQGNVGFRPAATVAFYDEKGKKAGTAQLTSGEIAVGSRGVVKGTVSKGLATGNYRAVLELANADGFVLATFNTTQQVIDKQVVLQASVDKFAPPSDSEPFFTVELSNSGNVAIDAEGIVLVADSSNNIVGQVPLEKKHLAEKATASYKRALPDGLDSGLYELRLMLNYGGDKPATKTINHFVK